MPTITGKSYHTVPAHSSRPVSLNTPERGQDLFNVAHGAPVQFDIETEVDLITQSDYPNGTLEHEIPPRRTVSLAHQNDRARDLHSPRHLVVVMPPPDFPLDQSQLGSVLSMGPRHRLSQGILMPLFPTMRGQLSAIAREFNFPSTVGICLYFHIAKNGVTMSPRISDDSWNYLWGHLFDTRSPARGQQLPVGGSIEFDIDLNKALWFDAWVSGALRDAESMLRDPRSLNPLTHRWQADSQTTYPDEQPGNEDRSQNLGSQANARLLRDLPRKLSLVEPFKSQALQSTMKVYNMPHLDPLMQTTEALSPILQSTAPETVRAELEPLATPWGANAQLDPAPMVESYQPAPDIRAAVTAAVVDEYVLEHNTSAINRTNFSWSSPSADPPSLSESTTPYSPSTHICRAYGAKSLTPTTTTSEDAFDDDRCAPTGRLLYPKFVQHVAKSMDGILTTSSIWGSSFGWRSATTWHKVYPFSVDLGKPIIQVWLQGPGDLLPRYPNLVIYPDAYPYLTIYPHVICNRPEPLVVSRPTFGTSFGWQKASTWRTVWPYSTSCRQALSPVSIQLDDAGLALHYPHLRIYPHVYPHLDIYPACVIKGKSSQMAFVLDKESSDSMVRCSALETHSAIHSRISRHSPTAEVGEAGPQFSQVNAQLLVSERVLSPYPNVIIYPAITSPSTVKSTNGNHATPISISLFNAGGLVPMYPNLIIYPSTYPDIEVYPSHELVAAERSSVGCHVDAINKSGKAIISSAFWGSSFGWQKATTWLKVWPLHAADNRNTGRRGSRYTSGPRAVWGTSFGWKRAHTWRDVYPLSFSQKARPNIGLVLEYPDSATYPSHVSTRPVGSVIFNSQSVWGSSLGWAKATTWRAVWPISVVPEQMRVPISVTLSGSGGLPSKFPDLVIYPPVYPCLDLYRPITKVMAENSSLKIIEEPNSYRRRHMIEKWRARTSAQIEVAAILANNHYWEADEPTELNPTDYTWSITSAGPPSPPLQSPSSMYRLPSIHIDRRLEGSVLLTPSTTNTRDLLDYDSHPDVSMELTMDDDASYVHSYETWSMGPPPQAEKKQNRVMLSGKSSVFVPEYPHLVIYPAAYPYFDIYPAWMKTIRDCENAVYYPQNSRYPIFDIYPAVYPHFNFYPFAGIEVKTRSEQGGAHSLTPVRVTLAPAYPDFDIYPPCYPHNLNHIYHTVTAEESKISVKLPPSYPWLVIYPSLYPFVTPYPILTAEIGRPKPLRSSRSTDDAAPWKSFDVKLSVEYPVIDLYPAVYPWNLANVYPPVTIDGHLGTSVRLPSRYPWIDIYPTVYPFVQPYPSIAGGQPDTLCVLINTEGKYAESTLHHRYPAISPSSLTIERPRSTNVYHKPLRILGVFDSQPSTTMLRQRRTHAELHVTVFRSLEKQPGRIKKTHYQLHNEVFKNGMNWTPSGNVHHSTEKSRADVQQEARYRSPPNQETLDGHPLRSRAETITSRSPDRVVFPLGQPPAMPPIPPLRVRSAGVPSQPSPAVSESPIPRVSPATSPTTPTRTVGSRLSQAVKSIIPGVHRRNSSAALRSPTSNIHKGHSSPKDRQGPMRFLSLSRPNAVAPPLPGSPSEFLTRSIPAITTQQSDSLVLQRAKAYEQPGRLDS